MLKLLLQLGDRATAPRTLVVSLHAFPLARTHCDRIVGLRAGEVVFDRPATEVTDAMAAALYDLDPT